MPTAVPKALVRKRCFVQMTGYEPVGPEHQHRRFIREMARFQKAWNVEGAVSPPLIAGNGAVAVLGLVALLRINSGIIPGIVFGHFARFLFGGSGGALLPRPREERYARCGLTACTAR